jgi:hypothetical protein
LFGTGTIIIVGRKGFTTLLKFNDGKDTVAHRSYLVEIITDLDGGFLRSADVGKNCQANGRARLLTENFPSWFPSGDASQTTDANISPAVSLLKKKRDGEWTA